MYRVRSKDRIRLPHRYAALPVSMHGFILDMTRWCFREEAIGIFPYQTLLCVEKNDFDGEFNMFISIINETVSGFTN